jgi:hypothetical protein
VLKQLLDERPNHPWLEGERRKMVEGLVSHLFEPGASIGAGFFAVEVVDSGLANNRRDQFLLTLLGVRAIANGFASSDPGSGTLKPQLAERVIDVLDSATDPDDEPIRGMAGRTLAAIVVANMDGWIGMANELASLHGRLTERLRYVPRHRIDRREVRRNVSQLVNACDAMLKDIRRIRPRLIGTEFEELTIHLDELIAYGDTVRHALTDLMR